MPIYRVASRHINMCDITPAVLDKNFTQYGNTIIPYIFNNIEDIKKWLSSASIIKTNNSMTMNNKYYKGDPNVIYSVYLCDHDDKTHNNDNSMCDKFMCNLKMIIQNDKIICIQLNNIIPFYANHENMRFSASARNINGVINEGIIPVNNDDKITKIYNKYATNIHNMDINKNIFNNISIIYVNNNVVKRWVELFIKKMEYVENHFISITKNSNTFIKIDKSYTDIIDYIFELINKNMNNNDGEKNKIRAMINNPIFYDNVNNIYHCRYKDTFITWHKYYKYVLQTCNIMPSRDFSDFIINFDLTYLHNQIHSKEKLIKLIHNIYKIYNIPYNPAILLEHKTEPYTEKQLSFD